MLRFLSGMGGIGAFVTAFVLAVEHAGSRFTMVLGVVIMIPFSILAWLNISIYKKLSEQAVLLRRTGQKHLRKREMRLGKQVLSKLPKSFKNI